MGVPLVSEIETEPVSDEAMTISLSKSGRNTVSSGAIRDDGALVDPWSILLQVSNKGEAFNQDIEVAETIPAFIRNQLSD